MIDAKVTIKGELDAQPLIKDFHFDGEIDLIVLSNTTKRITDKLSKKAKINVDEVLLIYLHCFIFGLESNAKISDMSAHISKLLSYEQVMIGVPETLREIRIDITGDGVSESRIVLNNPIPTPKYGIYEC